MCCEFMPLGISTRISAHSLGHVHQMFCGGAGRGRRLLNVSAHAVDTSRRAHSEFYSGVLSDRLPRLGDSRNLTSCLEQHLIGIRQMLGVNHLG